MNRKAFIGLVSLVAVCAACAPEAMTEAEPVLSATAVELPADVEVGGVKADISIVSNQSWTARIEGYCPWARLSGTEHINPSQVTDEGHFTVELENNGAYAPRQFDVKVVGKDLDTTVTIIQSAKKNRIRVASDTAKMLDAEPEKEYISILSNTDWTAVVDSSSTGACKLSKVKGTGDASLSVTFEPNYSVDSTRTVTVLFCCKDADTVKVEYVQGRNVPFIRIDEANASGTLLPIDTTFSVSFIANLAWKAEVISSDIKGFALRDSSGLAGEGNTAVMDFGMNTDDEVKHAVVKLSLADCPDVWKEVRISQRKGVVLHLDFSNGAAQVPLVPQSANDIPIAVSGWTKYGGVANKVYNYNYQWLGQTYEFTLKATEFYYYLSGVSFYGSQVIMGIPSIEGRKLIEVQVLVGGSTAKNFSVCQDSNGSAVLDGGIKYSVPAGKLGSWVLTNSEEDTGYYLRMHDKGTQVKKFTFIYE